MMMKKATQKEGVAVIWVFWDMNMCPVPAGCDPGVVRGCIERLLEKNGYCGPLNVTAYGKLGDVPRDMLRGVYSSGIALINVRRGSPDFIHLVDLSEKTNPPPANFMLISDPDTCRMFSQSVRRQRYNLLKYGSLETLILENPRDEFEEETTGELPLWDCRVCSRDPPGQGFENFTTHLDSEEHQELMLTRRTETLIPPVNPAMIYDWYSQLPYHRANFLPPPAYQTRETPRGLETDWEAVKSEGETFVLWDVNLCPVPPGCDASLVGPCIKSFLRKEGCYGPLTIIATGVLADVPTDILRKVYSSGIALFNVPHGPLDTANLINGWSRRPGPLCNIMVISNAKVFTFFAGSLKRKFNLLNPFPNDSLQSFCLADPGTLEEDECSETGESAFWICSVCDCLHIPLKGFVNFTDHLSSAYHQRKLSELLPIRYEHRILSSPLSEPLEINLEAVTSVFWDIKRCPVPPGCDPRRVGPCIKRSLENKGYSGPLTITAIGVLTDIPFDILGGVYSSGIALMNTFKNGLSTYADLLFGFTLRNPSPANILVISNEKSFTSDDAFRLQSRGYNLIQPFTCDSLESFFLADSGPVEEDKCSETSESALWICKVCSHDGRGFENFTNHVTSRRHERKLLDWLPGNARFLRSENTPNHGDKAKKEDEEAQNLKKSKGNDSKSTINAFTWRSPCKHTSKIEKNNR